MLNIILKLEDKDEFDMAFKEGLQDSEGNMVKEMIKDTNQFNIRDKKYTYNDKDQIFFRSDPNPN